MKVEFKCLKCNSPISESFTLIDADMILVEWVCTNQKCRHRTVYTIERGVLQEAPDILRRLEVYGVSW